jgi:hypothetical protein
MNPSNENPGRGDPNIKLVEVFIAQGEVQAQLIRAMLEGDGIESMFQGEAIRLTHGITVDGLAEVKILVREEDEDRAREIIETFLDGEGQPE